MRITSLEICNFKAVRRLSLSNLGDAVLIAGPNGCGKSCVLDAIRLLKSVYGTYGQQNEWQGFFNEFQLNLNDAEEVQRLFTDRSKPLEIAARFRFTPKEKDFMRSSAKDRIYRAAFQRQLLRGGPRGTPGSPLLPDAEKIATQAEADSAAISAELDRDEFDARLKLNPGGLRMETSNSRVLQFAFGLYEPSSLGIIDYHGPHRAYQRERLGGINVSIEQASQQLADRALANWQSKYTNIKSELAAAFVRDLIIAHAGGGQGQVPSILKTLQDLFRIFLPEKAFEGPRAGIRGELSFPVRVAGGGTHDIDDLSSGEKELVYGYLRIRNESPANSVILLDEPELHLNPRIVLGLPGFYREHLGLELSNQLWMVTHSDAFLRDAFRTGGFSIFHMTPPTTARPDENQAVPISATDQVNRAIIDLVGDMAGFRPGNKVVVFESSEAASFDATMTTRLFPEFAERINALSGDNKAGVRQLYEALNKAVRQIGLPFDIYAIVDRDTERDPTLHANTKVFAWDVYHIENYLLEPPFIRKVLKDNFTYAADMTEEEILEALHRCARDTLSGLVAHRLRAYVNANLVKCLDLGFDPALGDAAVGLTGAVARVNERIGREIAGPLGDQQIRSRHDEIEKSLRQALDDGSWRSEFQGRDILKRFAGAHVRGLPYIAFRDAILARMGDAGFQPEGMKRVVSAILAGSAPVGTSAVALSGARRT